MGIESKCPGHLHRSAHRPVELSVLIKDPSVTQKLTTGQSRESLWSSQSEWTLQEEKGGYHGRRDGKTIGARGLGRSGCLLDMAKLELTAAAATSG